MDYGQQILEIVLNGLLGGGCLVGILNWISSRKSKKRGVSGIEHVAVSQASTPPVPLGTPDWEALTRYWQKELEDTRNEYRMHKIDCGREIRWLEAFIQTLEDYIWRTTGKEPPARPTREKDN
jgi:hypothetical protein